MEREVAGGILVYLESVVVDEYDFLDELYGGQVSWYSIFSYVFIGEFQVFSREGNAVVPFRIFYEVECYLGAVNIGGADPVVDLPGLCQPSPVFADIIRVVCIRAFVDLVEDLPRVCPFSCQRVECLYVRLYPRDACSGSSTSC